MYYVCKKIYMHVCMYVCMYLFIDIMEKKILCLRLQIKYMYV